MIHREVAARYGQVIYYMKERLAGRATRGDACRGPLPVTHHPRRTILWNFPHRAGREKPTPLPPFLHPSEASALQPAVAERFGADKAELARRGEMVAEHDLWIAAHALVHGATVVTNNERDFGRMAGLRFENWTK